MKTKQSLNFCKLTKNASSPTKATPDAAGFDLYSAHDIMVPAWGKTTVFTDIQIELPTGTYGQIASRSGLAQKYSLSVVGGVIDRDYRGNVGVILFNHSAENYNIKKGDKMAQLICQKIEYPILLEKDQLEETIRGSNGFGSTN